MKTKEFAGSINQTHPQAARLQVIALSCLTLAAVAMLIAGVVDGSASTILILTMLFVGPLLVGAGLARCVIDVYPSLSSFVGFITALGSLCLSPLVGLFYALGDWDGGWGLRMCIPGDLQYDNGWSEGFAICAVDPRADRVQLPIHLGVVVLLLAAMVFSFRAIGAIARESGWRAKNGA